MKASPQNRLELEALCVFVEGAPRCAADAALDGVLQGLGDDAAYVHARHTGEWCARIAASLALGPDPAFLRRCGALAEVDPQSIERVPELASCAPVVRAFQRFRMLEVQDDELRTAAIIVAVADEFDARVMREPEAAAQALRLMWRHSTGRRRSVVAALVRALRMPHNDRRRRNA